jgi:hypothetical protein
MRILLFIFILTSCHSSNSFELEFQNCVIELPKYFKKRSDGTYHLFNEVTLEYKDISFVNNAAVYLLDEKEAVVKENVRNINVYRVDDFFILDYRFIDSKNESFGFDRVSLISKNKTIHFTGFSHEDLRPLVKVCNNSWYPSTKEELLEYVNQP